MYVPDDQVMYPQRKTKALYVLHGTKASMELHIR